MRNVVFLDIDGVLNTWTSCVVAPSGQYKGIDASRVAILKKKAESYKVFINEDVLSYIAERIDSNVRELEGAYKQVYPVGSAHAGRVIRKVYVCDVRVNRLLISYGFESLHHVGGGFFQSVFR